MSSRSASRVTICSVLCGDPAPHRICCFVDRRIAAIKVPPVSVASWCFAGIVGLKIGPLAGHFLGERPLRLEVGLTGLCGIWSWFRTPKSSWLQVGRNRIEPRNRGEPHAGYPEPTRTHRWDVTFLRIQADPVQAPRGACSPVGVATCRVCAILAGCWS